MIEEIEKEINNYLLRDIVFITENKKVIKRGKLLLYRFKEFYLTFNIINEAGENKIFEIPYPFRYSVKNNNIELSYKLDDFSRSNVDLLFKVQILNKTNANKYYNNKLVLSAV
jgi:hypothetical protein